MNGSLSSSSSSSSSSSALPLLLIITLIIISNSNNNGCCHGFSSTTTISTIITSPSSSSPPFIMAPTKNLLFVTNPRRRRRRRTQRRSSTRSTSTCLMMNDAPDDEEIKRDDENLPNNSLSVSSFFSFSGIDSNNIEDTFQVQASGRVEEEGEGELVYSAEISSNDRYAIVRLDDESNSVVMTTTTVFWTIYNNNIQNDKDDDDHDHDDHELLVDVGDKKYNMIKEALLGKMNKCWIVVKEASTTTTITTTMDDDDYNNITNAMKIRVNNPEELRQAVSSVKVMNNSSLFLDRENNKPPSPPPYLIFADDDDDDDKCYINRDAIDISTLKRRYRTNELHCIDKSEGSAIIYSANLINFDKSKTNNNNKMIFWTLDKDNTNHDNENKIENDNENNDGKDDPFSVIYSAYNDEQMKFIELFNPSDVVTTKLRIITSRIVRSVSHIRNLSSGLGWWLIYDDSNKEEEEKEGTTNEEIIMNRKKPLSLLSMGLLSGGGWMWLWKVNQQPLLHGYRNIITQFLNDCLYGATTGIISNNYIYLQILGKSIVLLLFLRFILINLLLKKLLIGRRIISNNSNNDYYFLKPIGINNHIVQNLSTISIMISNVMLLSNSVLQFLFLAFIKVPIFITLKLLSSILVRISNNINMSVFFPSSDEDKQNIKFKKKQQQQESLLKNLSLKIRTVANQVLLWKVAPSNKSSLISLAAKSDDYNDNSNGNGNGNVKKSFIRINAAFLGPIKEELIFRYAFDKIWHGVEGFLFSMMSSTRIALILGSGNKMKETASAATAGGGSLSANTPAWIWMNSLLFGLIHMGNWFPIRKDNVASSTSKFNAWDNIYGALFQCTISFIGARFLFNPLYTKRGIAASIGAHIALNTFVMAFSFGGSKPTDDEENSNEERR